MKQMVYDFDKWFQMVMQKIKELVVDRTKMQVMIEEKMQIILQAIQVNNTGDFTPMNGNTAQCPHKTLTNVHRPTPSGQQEPANQSYS